jgi:hypothetical protein
MWAPSCDAWVCPGRVLNDREDGRMALENAEDHRSGPGPWFVAQLAGNCSRCGHDIEPGDTIRADGWGSWECCDSDDEPHCRDRFTGTSDEEMGF